MSDTGQDADRHLPLKPLDFSVLLVLTEGDMHGYGIVKRIGEATSGGIRLAPSNLYHVLDRMIAAGLVEGAERPEDSEGSRRRYYAITPLGGAVVRAEAARLDGLLHTARRLRILP